MHNSSVNSNDLQSISKFNYLLLKFLKFVLAFANFVSSAKKHRKRDQFADFLVRKNVMQNSEKFLNSKAK